MKKVFKYPVIPGSNMQLRLPRGAQVLGIEAQPLSMADATGVNQALGMPNLFVWALIDPDEQVIEAKFFDLVRTGDPMHAPEYKYINTLFIFGGEEVYHFFEIL